MSNYYYSGQGSLYVASRTAGGRPEGLLPVGNVPTLTLDIATTNFEHKESETGQRVIDLVIEKEKKGTFAFKLENLSLDNLALGLFGTKATVAGSSVVAEILKLYKSAEAGISLRSPVAFPDISAVVVRASDGVAAVTRANTTAYALGAYIVPATPNTYYYKVTTAGTSGGTIPTFPTTAGATVTDGTAVLTNMGKIIKQLTTDYTLNAKPGSIIIPSTSSVESGRDYEVDYTYASSKKLDVFTEIASVRWLRFEGLNTVDDTQVMIDIFKAQFDPLTGYGLITEDLGSVDMKGTILSDPLQLTGSTYFRQWNIDA